MLSCYEDPINPPARRGAGYEIEVTRAGEYPPAAQLGQMLDTCCLVTHCPVVLRQLGFDDDLRIESAGSELAGSDNEGIDTPTEPFPRPKRRKRRRALEPQRSLPYSYRADRNSSIVRARTPGATACSAAPVLAGRCTMVASTRRFFTAAISRCSDRASCG